MRGDAAIINIRRFLPLQARRRRGRRSTKHADILARLKRSTTSPFRLYEPTWRRKRSKNSSASDHWPTAASQQSPDRGFRWLKVWYWNQRPQLKRLALTRVPAAFARRVHGGAILCQHPCRACEKKGRVTATVRGLMLASLAAGRVTNDASVMRGTRDNLCATITLSLLMICGWVLCAVHTTRRGRMSCCIYPTAEARDSFVLSLLLLLASHCIAFARVGGRRRPTTTGRKMFEQEES
jgi:hypothetical protein